MRRRLLALAVIVLAVLTAGCDWRVIVPEGPAPLRYRDEVFTNVTTTANVAYGSAVEQDGDTLTLRLDVYRPTGDTVQARPAIVWIHGGGFTGGSRTSTDMVALARLFARKGYVTVSISYRLSPVGCFPPGPECLQGIKDAQHDAQAAVRFLRANADTYDVDPNRIAAAGSSAGAITALNVGFANSDDVGNSGNPGFPSTVSAAMALSGAAVRTTPEAGEAPSLLFHGTADNVVQYSAGVNTQAAAEDAGLISYLTSFEGVGHSVYSSTRVAQIHTETTNFFYHMLDLGDAAR